MTRAGDHFVRWLALVVPCKTRRMSGACIDEQLICRCLITMTLAQTDEGLCPA